MQSKPDNSAIKRMAELLRQGATLTDLACPQCSSPLFRLQDGTLWCGTDEKRVLLLKEGEEPPKVTISPAMDKLEATLMAKVTDLQDKIQHTENVEELTKITTALGDLLDNLEKVKRIKKS